MTKISNFGKQNSILGSVVPLAMFIKVFPIGGTDVEGCIRESHEDL